MQAEARREFEFVLDFLPDNQTLVKLLAQTPLPEEETLVVTHKEVSPEIVVPEQTQLLSPENEYPVSESPEVLLSPEPTFSFGEVEPTPTEQDQEPVQVTSPETSFFDGLTQAPPATSTEDKFDFGVSTPAVEPPTTFETSPFSEFNFPQPEPLIPQTPSPSVEVSKDFEFTPPSFDIDFLKTSAASEGESFENYTLRRKKELSDDNTVSLEDYLSSKTSAKPQEFTLPITDSKPQEFILPNTGSISTGIQDKIEELTNKLQSAGKITPIINFAQKETPAASEQDTPAGMGFVTPTLAEIYAKQGWFDDAIKAYKTLVHNKPAEKERYEKRIAELEELKKKGGG